VDDAIMLAGGFIVMVVMVLGPSFFEV